MISKFRLILVAAFGLLGTPRVLSQEPEHFHPLWENSDNASVPTAVIGEGNPAPEPLPDNPAPEGFSLMSVDASIAQEITELAAALGNDPVKIFNHVRNTIGYEHYYGLRKGPELTLLEGSGNDLDTCTLLAEILKAAGHTDIQFCLQIREVPILGNGGKNMSEWMGLTETPQPTKTFAQAFGSANPYPVDDLTAKRLHNASLFATTRRTQFVAPWTGYEALGITRFWLRLTYGGSTYDLDPAFKRYEKIGGVDLAAAAGYLTTGQNRAALLSTAGGTAGAGFISALNKANIGNFLNARTGNFLNYLNTQASGATLEEIVSGRRIIKENITHLNQAFPLPNTSGSGYGALSTWTSVANIPNGYKSWVYFTSGGLSYNLPTSQLKGRKLSLAAVGNEVQLWLDEAKVAFTTVAATSYSFTMTVTHPNHATSYVETKPYLKGNTYVYALIYAFNASGKLIQKRHEELARHLLTDSAGTGRAARSEILNIMGLTWMYQTGLATKGFAAQNEVSPLSHHRFGRMAQELGFYVDVGLQTSSHYAYDSEDGERYARVFHLAAMFASAMEHGVIEQMQPGSSAVSTVNILRRANEIGDKRIYVINNALVTSGANWTAAKTALAAYNAAATKNARYDDRAEPFTDSNGNGRWDSGEPYTDLTELGQFQFIATNGGSLMLPANRAVSETGWDWSGSGWVIRTATRVGMIINGSYSGGYSTNYGSVIPAPVSNFASFNPSYSYSPPSQTSSLFVPPSFSAPSFFGSDPVDMATGAFSYANDDLVTGTESAPRGLAFSRYYTSNSRESDSQNIGYGWTHSLHIRLAERTASEEALGLGNPRQAAAFLTAMAITSDLYRADATAKEWAITSLAVGWYLDRLTNNAVSVIIGQQNFQFTKNPDGSYEPPTGSTMGLTKVGTEPNHTYRMTQRHSNTFVFEKEAGNTDGSSQRLKQIVDPDSRTMNFAYLTSAPLNRLNYVEDAVGRRYTFRYDVNNRIDRVTDSSDARFISFAYDGQGNQSIYTDAESKDTYYDYRVQLGQLPVDPSGTVPADHRIVRLRNHDGQIITQNVYDALGRVSEQYLHGDDSKTWKLRYTGTANTEENPAGGITTYFYDERGRATGKRDPLGLTESWVYDGRDQIVEKTTGSGETTVYHYDAKYNLTRIDHPRGGGSTQMFYDSLDRLDLTIDPNDAQTDHVYNVGNTKARPDQIIDPAGTTTFTYKTTGAAIGRPWKITDGNNLVTEYEYDTRGHPLWIKAPGGFQTLYNYSPRGDLLEFTDPTIIKTVSIYNSRRQVTKTTTDPGGATESVEDYFYNNQGLLARQTEAPDNDGQRFVTRHEYSPTEKPRFTRTSDNNGEGVDDPTTEVTYDGRDWQYQSLDPAARLTTFTPLANGQPWKTTIPGTRVKTQVQDGDGRPLGGTVPGPTGTRSSSFVYDVAPSGFPRTTTTTADGLSVSEVQDRAGKPRFYTNRKSQVWEFRYDGLGRKTHVITPLDAAAGRSHLTEYHHRGVVKKVTEPSGQVTDFTYNGTSGRLTGVSDGVGTISHTAYDDNGNLQNTSEVRGGSTKTTGRTYDRQSRLLTRTDENGQTIGYRYYPSGKLAMIIYPGGSESGTGRVEYTWWPSGQLKDVIDKLDSATSPRVTSYVWNKDGRLAKVTRENGTTRQIKYDATGRPDVIEEYGPGMKLIFVHKHGFYPSDEMAWRYELPAKRTSGNDPPAMLAMTYNADNQLATWDGQTITHDADGNMTSGPAPIGGSLISYSYDARNRLTGTLGTTYTYDADNQRVGLIKGVDTTTFAIDVSSKLSKVLVRTKNGVPTRYVWGLGLLYEVNGTGSGALTTTYHHDATGSTIALTNSNGSVIERIGYTPWGQINHRVNVTGTPHDTPFLFTGFFGNQTDDNGLLYMRARYYHPRLGRFLNADPAQEGMNWYGYAGGNPIGMVDPMGLGIEGALDAVQTTLSFLGMVPVFGAVFDIVNAGISIGRGNYLDAAMNLASAIPGIGDFVGGAKIATASSGLLAGALVGARWVDNAASLGKYEVGAYNALRKGASAGLEAHHVGQKAIMSNFIPTYNATTAPSILVPKLGHTLGSGVVSRSTVGFTSARQVVARDIRELRRVYPDIPNSQLQKLIDLNKSMYPAAFAKPPTL